VSINDATLFNGAIKIEQTSPATVRLTTERPILDMEREALHQLHHTLGMFLRQARRGNPVVQYDTFTGAARPLLHSNLGGFP
jgi:hypothetical protein